MTVYTFGHIQGMMLALQPGQKSEELRQSVLQAGMKYIEAKAQCEIACREMAELTLRMTLDAAEGQLSDAAILAAAVAKFQSCLQTLKVAYDTLLKNHLELFPEDAGWQVACVIDAIEFEPPKPRPDAMS